MLRPVLVAVLTLVGCKSKQEASTPVARPSPTEAPAPVAAPSSADLLVAGSSPALGCFAWSAATLTVGCIGGTRSNTGGENDLVLDILDGRPSIRLTDPLDADTASRNNTVLAGFAMLAGPATSIPTGKPIEITKGLSLTLTEKQTKPGGDNEPPTKKFVLSAACGGSKTDVFSIEDEGSEVTARARVLGDAVVVEAINKVAREGEYFESAEAAAIAVATCRIIRAGGQ